MSHPANAEQRYKPLIVVLSVAIPVVVALLFTIRVEGYDTSFLPPIYAGINALTACILITALVAIKNRRRRLHEILMKLAIALSTLFLLLYVVYHGTSDSTPYGGTGWMRTFYFALLISHILLSITIIPLVLFTYVRAIAGNFARHRRLARITFPLWLYVAVSGVLVYLLIAPYYA